MHFVGGDVVLHDEATIWWLDRSLYCPALSSTSVLRILLKQNTALLSYVRVCVSHRRDISSFLDNFIV